MKRELIVERTARSSKYDRRNRIGRRPSDGVLWGGTGTHARRLSSVLKGTRLQEASYDRGLQECNQRYYGQVKLHVGRRRFRKFHYIGRYALPKADD
jgi:hypothetical protein